MTKDYETIENDPKEPGVIHHGGEVGESAERLSDDSSTKEEQSEAGQDLAEHGNDPDLHPENN